MSGAPVRGPPMGRSSRRLWLFSLRREGQQIRVRAPISVPYIEGTSLRSLLYDAVQANRAPGSDAVIFPGDITVFAWDCPPDLDQLLWHVENIAQDPDKDALWEDLWKDLHCVGIGSWVSSRERVEITLYRIPMAIIPEG